MRERKYKVWDTGLKKFAGKTDFYITPGGEVCFYWNKESFHSTRAILIDFSGRHYKNGEGIFEGDIVESKVAHKGIYTCEFEGSAFVFKPLDNKRNPTLSVSYFMEKEMPEKIGTIYENPELLK